MNNEVFSPNQRVRIIADENFSTTNVEGSTGVVVSTKGYCVDVLITSGDFLGKTLSFIKYHLTPEK